MNNKWIPDGEGGFMEVTGCRTLADVAARCAATEEDKELDETERFVGRVMTEEAKLSTKQAKAIPILLADVFRLHRVEKVNVMLKGICIKDKH